jgi:disulfide bond formation protein DsbB
MFDKSAFIPPAAGAGVSGAKFLGLAVPDWVGLATIAYLAVMSVIAVLKYLKERKK